MIIIEVALHFLSTITQILYIYFIIVGVIYRPNTLPLADVDIFTTTLFGVMDEINHENKKCVILGDMNINMLKYGVHNQTDTYVDGIFSRGFLPQIIMPTSHT